MEESSKPPIQRAATTDGPSFHENELLKPDSGNKESSSSAAEKIRKSVSMDSGEAETVTKTLTSFSGSFKRRSIRRRSSKRIRPEPEREFGHDTESYEKIRERVLQERAVTNAIDALQERWRMIMFMYEDCVAMNEEKNERKLKKLCVKRQFELIVIAVIFFIICLPITILFGFMSR